VNPFEQAMTAVLEDLLRAGVPARGVRLTVRELVVARIERGPLGAREITEAVEATVRAASHVVYELNAPDEMLDAVCRAALEAVRGHGGTSARWLDEATNTVSAVVDELTRDRAEEPTWRWLAQRRAHW
jgi:hypothetical protein